MTVVEFFRFVRHEGKLLRVMKAEQDLNMTNLDYLRGIQKNTPEFMDKRRQELLLKIERKSSERAREIVDKINLNLTLVRIADKYIDLLERSEDRAIMRERYVLCHSWEMIMQNQNWSESAIMRMHRRALEEITRKVENSEEPLRTKKSDSKK